MSRTVTVKPPLIVFPAASVAVQVTAVEPSGKTEPEAWEQARPGAASRLSVAEKPTIAPAGEVASATASPGSVGAVRSTVHSNVSGGLWPSESMARTWNV